MHILISENNVPHRKFFTKVKSRDPLCCPQALPPLQHQAYDRPDPAGVAICPGADPRATEARRQEPCPPCPTGPGQGGRCELMGLAMRPMAASFHGLATAAARSVVDSLTVPAA